MHVNSHPHRSTEGRGMAARGDSNTKETKNRRKESFEDGKSTFYL